MLKLFKLDPTCMQTNLIRFFTFAGGLKEEKAQVKHLQFLFLQHFNKKATGFALTVTINGSSLI